jgi:hypothetical protein
MGLVLGIYYVLPLSLLLYAYHIFTIHYLAISFILANAYMHDPLKSTSPRVSLAEYLRTHVCFVGVLQVRMI